MSSHHHDVTRFHLRLGLPVADRLTIIPKKEFEDRARFIHEELEELEDAGDRLYHGDTDMATLAQVFDALIDIVYVAVGTAVQMGFPWQNGWDLVQTANMQKERGPDDGTGHKLGVVKPAGWRPPNIAACLHDFEVQVKELLADAPEGQIYVLRCQHGIHRTEPCPECELARLFQTDGRYTDYAQRLGANADYGVDLAVGPDESIVAELCPHGRYTTLCTICTVDEAEGPAA